MEKKFLEFKLNFGNFNQNFQNIINYYNNMMRQVQGHMSQINPTTIKEAFVKGVHDRMTSRGIRMTAPMTVEILGGFQVYQTSSSTNAGNEQKTFKFNHDFYMGSPPKLFQQFGRTYETKRSVILDSLDSGRGPYDIGNGNFGSLISPKKYRTKLVWHHAGSSGSHIWGRYKGGQFIVLKPIHVSAADQPIMNKGIKIFEYGWKEVEKYITEKQAKIKTVLQSK